MVREDASIVVARFYSRALVVVHIRPVMTMNFSTKVAIDRICNHDLLTAAKSRAAAARSGPSASSHFTHSPLM